MSTSPGGPPWGRRWGPPRRPPWWPEGEPFPPVGRPPWGRIGRRLMWRIAWFAMVFFLIMAVFFIAAIVLVGTAAGVIHTHAGLRVLAIVSLFALLVIVVRAATRFRRMAIDMGSFIDATSQIAAGDYEVRVPERGPREIRTLARAFNDMSARLATTEQNRRSFVADLTHELHPPGGDSRASRGDWRWHLSGRSGPRGAHPRRHASAGNAGRCASDPDLGRCRQPAPEPRSRGVASTPRQHGGRIPGAGRCRRS